ncbi:MAG: cytochrome c3 family protein, partial [Opitutae bacterium]|nr:cytochrome c3 family protein [Opitutae bacterium]
MSVGGVPSPDFDETRYERPNQDWVCGHTCDGCPCRIGPSPKGECRATTECQPVLTTKEGETKGTWKCTRPKDWGGACPTGPKPDGTCCNAIPKCRPTRSVRNRRGLVTRTVIAASAGVLLVALAGPWREAFVNPAPLSQHHSGVEFEKMTAGRVGAAGQGCVSCHRETKDGFAEWTATAAQVGTRSLSFANLVSTHPKDFSRMDASCLNCHQPLAFHAANIARETSCAVCHVEHQGRGPLAAVASQNCTDCHGAPAEMRAAAEKGRGMPAAYYTKTHLAGPMFFQDHRPPEGFTETITSFAGDHPEFRALRPGSPRDENTLAFNHAVHLTGDIPTLGGKPLDCTSCHRPDSNGAFMQRISFERDCRACHSLQFDERNPGLELPHGDAVFVRAYLRSLPTQYADHATRKLRLPAPEIPRYVEAQMLQLRTRARTGELLEEHVFFSDLKKGPVARIAGLDGPARAKFAGCASCHEVTPRPNSAPRITPPVMPDRWLHRGQFDHAKHTQMACASCHATATKSKLTAEILMPTQQSCVRCHSPKGGVRDTCTECHNYPIAPPPGW